MNTELNRDNLPKKLKALGIGRFQVMALLQAARYYIVYGSTDKAKSYGLNRAIFYAWAKHHGPSKNPVARLRRIEEIARRGEAAGSGESRCREGYVNILGECVMVGRNGYYMIGEREQLPGDFDYQVYRRLKPLIDPEKAWKTALDYVSRFPRRVLEDPALFYKYIYEPVRDTFFIKLLSENRVEPPREILDRLKFIDKKNKGHKSITDYFR